MIKNSNRFFDVSLAILCFTLPFSLALPNIFLGISFLIFFLKKNKNYQIQHYFFCIAVFTVYLILKSIFFKTFETNLFYWDNLFLLLSVFCLLNNVTNKIIVIKGFTIGVAISALLSLVRISIFYANYGSLPFGNSSEVNNFIFIHRPYLGFMSFISIVLFDILIEKSKNSKEKKLFFVLKIVIIAFLFILMARLAMLLSFIYISIYYFNKLSSLKYKLFFVGVFTGLSFFLVSNKNFSERFHLQESYNKTINKFYNYEPRFVIWNCVINIIEQSDFNIWFGFKDFSLVNKKLDSCYAKTIDNPSKKKYYLKKHFNTHNQFMDVFLKGGVFGLIFIVLFIFFAFKTTLKERRLQIFSVFFGILTFCLFENIFDRQFGIYIFAFCFFLISNNVKDSFKKET